MGFLSGIFKGVKKLFKPKNLFRIAGAVLGGVPGLLIANKLTKTSKASNSAGPVSEDATKAVTTYTTQSSAAPPSQLPAPASVTTNPAVASGGAQPQFGTSGEPIAMKLQQTASPYGGAAAMAAQAAQAKEAEQVRPTNQFLAPSMQGITFGGA
jgi:cytoskeletal protein RodZ